MARGYVFGWVLAITVGALASGFVVRWALKLVFRAERMPRAEAFVDRWWVWSPLVGVVALLWYYEGTLLGLVAALAAVALMRHWDRLSPGLSHRP